MCNTVTSRAICIQINFLGNKSSETYSKNQLFLVHVCLYAFKFVFKKMFVQKSLIMSFQAFHWQNKVFVAHGVLVISVKDKT